MTRAQEVADAFRAVGVELLPDKAEAVLELVSGLTLIAGAPVQVAFGGALLTTDPVLDRITFRRLES